MQKGIERPDAPGLPDAAIHMMNTKALNQYLGTNYSLEEVADMDPLLFEIMSSLQRGMNPQPADKKRRK